jgi:hypothetical protein
MLNQYEPVFRSMRSSPQMTCTKSKALKHSLKNSGLGNLEGHEVEWISSGMIQYEIKVQQAPPFLSIRS